MYLEYFPVFSERLKYIHLLSFILLLLQNPLLNRKNRVCRKIDTIEHNQLMVIYKIPFNKVDGTLQYNIGKIEGLYQIES